MKKRLLVLLAIIARVSFMNAQESPKLDSISSDMIQSVYVEEPDFIDSNLRKSSLKAYPYAFYTPESKLAFGAGGMFVFYTNKTSDVKPSKIGFGGYYSTNNQYKISMNNIYYFAENKVYFKLPVSYGRFVNKYWGTGDQVNNYDSAGYTVQTFAATLTFQIPPAWFSADRTGVIVDFDYTDIVDKQSNKFLLNDSVPVTGSNGGIILGVGGDLLWDSRDNIFFPNKGGYQYFKAVFYPGMSDFVYANFELDVRHYRAFSKDHVLAGNFFLQSTVGDSPFYKLPSIGGKQMRGYFYGRYRDNFFAMMQLEYRQYFFKKFGFVVFGSVGNVSHTILDYDFSNLKYTYGGGLRYLFNEKERVNLRMDVGIGTDGSMGIYFGIEEAF
jgi:outer membrane protein assembly factor BamA